MDGRTSGWRGRLVCHCLLIEADSSLVLVDTGLGLRDLADPYARLSKLFLALLAPERRVDLTAVRQIELLGFDPLAVQHIVLTHLDFDHAGGLDDFPHAAVHLLRAERNDAVARSSMLDRMRYRPQQWSTRSNWCLYSADEGAKWFGFDCVRELAGLPPEILLVPLPGHTLGHAGVAIQRGPDDWLLHAGDAYFYHDEMHLQHPRCTPGLRFHQWLMEKDRSARLHNQRRLRELKHLHGRSVQILSAHDVQEFEELAHPPAAESRFEEQALTGTAC